MRTLRLLFLFITLITILTSANAAETKSLPAPKAFDERYFKIVVSYFVADGPGYNIVGTLNRVDSKGFTLYEGEITDSRYANGKKKRISPDGLLALALQLQHHVNIFDPKFTVGNLYPVCSGLAEVTIQIGAKSKNFKMCPNDPIPNKDYTRVMNWLVYLKNISHDQFEGPNTP